MVAFTDHSETLILLSEAQEAEKDQRKNVKENSLFLNKKDGQWEPKIITSFRGRPRYTFDKCNPIVDSISKTLSQSSFDIKVAPAGGDATKDLAKTFDGIIRNIENVSGFTNIMNMASRRMIGVGLSGFRIVQDWANSDAFDQDLLFKPLSNFDERVWFEPSSELQTRADADYVFVLQALSDPKYEKEFPDGSKVSVDQNIEQRVYTRNSDPIVVGEVLYKKPTTKTLILMTNEAVYEETEDFLKIVDELAAQKITEVRRRKRETFKVFQRFFDGGDWLTDEKETVFNLLPVVPMYANFQITENKVTYWGAVDRILDQQRVYNYLRSRQVEEGALSPREVFWMTPEQAKGHGPELSDMNISPAPVQQYNHVAGQPPPFKAGGYNVNPGLETAAQAASADINASSGQFGANLGENPGLQSGAAIDLQTKTGNANNIKYVESREIATCHAATILIGAIPKVYDQKRQLRILNEDGTEEIIFVNETVLDQESTMVTINDLNQGLYDVTCKAGISFSNRQEETVKAFTEIAAIDPTVMQSGSDIFFKNITSPGFDQIAERKRRQLLLAGQILPNQQTDEEKQLLAQLQQQQQQQQGQPDALSQAQLILAEAEQLKAEVLQQQANVELEEKKIKLGIDQERLNLDREKFEQSALNDDINNDVKLQKQQLDQLALIMKQQAQEVQNLKTQAETFGAWREAQGVETIIGPHVVEATINSADLATRSQEEIETNLAGTNVAGAEGDTFEKPPERINGT